MNHPNNETLDQALARNVRDALMEDIGRWRLDRHAGARRPPSSRRTWWPRKPR
jgi:hypothetical protein